MKTVSGHIQKLRFELAVRNALGSQGWDVLVPGAAFGKLVQTANPREQRVDLQREEEEYSERLTAISIFRRSSSLRYGGNGFLPCGKTENRAREIEIIAGAGELAGLNPLGGFGAERCSLDAGLNPLSGFQGAGRIWDREDGKLYGSEPVFSMLTRVAGLPEVTENHDIQKNDFMVQLG
ncbi:hypothetical protein Fmac_001471 [Flemingia macrophylla]|uniref:Uncharacterized protein n=1 Tax=Flemingia macrophylla TaxID=520843 RepID=A0ABD1NH74_9FABA